MNVNEGGLSRQMKFTQDSRSFLKVEFLATPKAAALVA